MSQQTITQFIDDRAPQITFFSSTASWNHESNPLEFNQTATWTQTAEDSLSISFNGTSISVFGTLDSSDFPPIQTSYQLDNPTIPILRLTNSSFIGETQFQQMFYQSPILDLGIHTLTITNLANGSTFRFDFAKVTSPNPSFQTVIRPPPSSTTVSAISTTITQDSASDISASTDSTDSVDISPMTLAQQTSSLLPTSTFLLTTTDNPTDSASSVQSTSSSTALSASSGTGNGTHLAAILGGILGGVGFLVWIVVFLVIQRRRRQRINRTRRMSEFLRHSSEKRPYQSNFTPVRRHDSQDMSSFGTPDPLASSSDHDHDSSSSSLPDRALPSTHELTPFTVKPTPESERQTSERSVWSPDLPTGREGKKRGYYYVDSPPKYNSGQFYHLES